MASAAQERSELEQSEYHWAAIVALVHRAESDKDPKKHVDLRPTLCAGIVWQAAKHALVRVDELIEEAEDHGRAPPKDELARADALVKDVPSLERRFDGLPGARQIKRHLAPALFATYILAIRADEMSRSATAHRNIKRIWEEAKEARLHQLSVLQTDLKINIAQDIYRPATLEVNVDRTTLAHLGLLLRTGTTEDEMGKRAATQEMPLERMGYRQRMRYAGAY
ncbi:hypothetical protein JCM6882_001097 [Rhodosporidiobolus microsporus]